MSKIKTSVVAMLAVWLTGCVGVQITVPATDPDKHPRPKTAPAEDLGIAYFRHRARWHQMRVSLTAGEPAPSGIGYIVKFSAEASLWRYNRRTQEYDIPADFVRTDAYQNYYIAREEASDPELVSIRHVSGSEGGGAAIGWRTRRFTELSALVGKPSSPPARRQTMSGVAAARYYPNGKSYPGGGFHFEAKVERNWVITAGAGNGIQVGRAE